MIPLATREEPFRLEAEPTHYVRSFTLGAFACWVWQLDGVFHWNVETAEGSEKARGKSDCPFLAESDARKAATALILEGGGVL